MSNDALSRLNHEQARSFIVAGKLRERAHPRPWNYVVGIRADGHAAGYITDAAGNRIFEKLTHDARPDGALLVAAVNLLETPPDETTAESFLREMLALHGLAYDAAVTAESYPGAAHEEAEERWIRKVQEFLAGRTPG